MRRRTSCGCHFFRRPVLGWQPPHLSHRKRRVVSSFGGLATGPDALPGKMPASKDEREIDGGAFANRLHKFKHKHESAMLTFRIRLAFVSAFGLHLMFAAIVSTRTTVLHHREHGRDHDHEHHAAHLRCCSGHALLARPARLGGGAPVPAEGAPPARVSRLRCLQRFFEALLWVNPGVVNSRPEPQTPNLRVPPWCKQSPSQPIRTLDPDRFCRGSWRGMSSH